MISVCKDSLLTKKCKPCLKDTETGESFIHAMGGGEGIVHGFALNKELLNHYIDVLGATYLGALHPYQFAFSRMASQKLLEVYPYEWN